MILKTPWKLRFADVILPINLPRVLTYGIPLRWQTELVPGLRVEVSVGKNKVYSGIVLQVHDQQPESYRVKPIRNVIDDQPIVTEVQLRFWQWVSQYYLCSLGDVMNAALPAHLKLMSESLLVWSFGKENPPMDLDDDAFIVAEALSIRKKLTIGEVRQLLNNESSAKVINELLERGIAAVTDQLEEKYKPKQEEYVVLTAPHQKEEAVSTVFKELEKAPKQLAIMLAYFQLKSKDGFVHAATLLKMAKAARPQLNALVEKGVLVLKIVEVDRIAFLSEPGTEKVVLDENQTAAYTEVKALWERKNVVLLHGVTGSGKTLIYIDLIREVLAKGQQVLFLLPEIALTTQVVMRLRGFFGEELGVYHSRFSNDERVEIWNKVASNKYKVVLGARSALWLPFQSLGLIIVDEEHESSYKQHEPAPRFHARDASIYLASLHKAKVLLGSATPSLESTFNAQQGKYGYVALTKRYLGIQLPEIELVSSKNIQLGLSSILTRTLLDRIQETFLEGKQVILFQNKRGYSPFLMCTACGWVAHCKYCDVSLTYHKYSDKLHCHYCGSKSTPIKHCQKCGQLRLVSKSYGTERIEEELLRIFPKRRVARMDWDSMRGKNRHSSIIQSFAQGRIDILVGTQMVVKGLDFENVGLVGILSADSLLNFPDFRVNERGFQLMEQVSGRAGRTDGRGKVVIQAHDLSHPVIKWVKEHDFRSFYQTELASRQQFGYPPFSRLVKLVCRHRNEKKAQDGIHLLANALQNIEQIEIKGPAPGMIPKVRNNYLQEVWLKLPLDATRITSIKAQILKAINNTLSTRGFSSLQIIVDVDPS